MNFYKKLVRSLRRFLSFTGTRLHTFEKLLLQFEQAHINLEAERKLKSGRTATDHQPAQNAHRSVALSLLLNMKCDSSQKSLDLFIHPKEFICG